MPAQGAHAASRVAAPFFSPNMPTPHPQRCEYTSKRCENARALKPNGERHRLCDHHRRLANNNQRRWQNRKKLQQRAEQSQISALLELRHATPASGMGLTDRPTARTRSIHNEAMPPYSAERQHLHPPAYRHQDMGVPRDTTTHHNQYQHNHSHASLPPLEQHRPPHQLRPQDQNFVLPRLRHHHVLSRALSLPVAHEVDFGGFPREHGALNHRTESVPPHRVAFERSTSAPGEGSWSSRERNDERVHRAELSWTTRARAVSSVEY